MGLDLCKDLHDFSTQLNVLTFLQAYPTSGGDPVYPNGSLLTLSSPLPSHHAGHLLPPFSSTPVPGAANTTHSSEMERMLYEHAHLMQTHQSLQEDLRAFREVRAEVRELVQVAQSLRDDLSQARGLTPSPTQPSVKKIPSHPVRSYETNFPDPPPPPWPEPDTVMIKQSCPPLTYVPDTWGFPLPPTPKELQELLTPASKPVPASS
ncbi:hypothetical protein KOW79_011888 [Hemibagrus wyckioides]|uniref:Uncharacterized protein n=1 Tax=Hemibagrus wyckioides TaxID=337641 RepID=A0A9D3NNQ7_9TELE|nr:hypothetical protein KOW79_011888 [Hemibagrus wyckioides]